jgi:hypothetical protein
MVTTPLGVATGVDVGVGVGLGVGGGFSITNNADGVGRAAASVNFGEANTAIVPATSTAIVSKKRMTVRIIFSLSRLVRRVGLALPGLCPDTVACGFYLTPRSGYFLR